MSELFLSLKEIKIKLDYYGDFYLYTMDDNIHLYIGPSGIDTTPELCHDSIREAIYQDVVTEDIVKIGMALRGLSSYIRPAKIKLNYTESIKLLTVEFSFFCNDKEYTAEILPSHEGLELIFNCKNEIRLISNIYWDITRALTISYTKPSISCYQYTDIEHIKEIISLFEYWVLNTKNLMASFNKIYIDGKSN